VRTMKIAVGGLVHETNTFNARRTELESFRTGSGLTVSGSAVLKHFANTRTVVGGFIAAASEYGYDLEPTHYAQAGFDTGLVSQHAFAHLERELLDAISSSRPDGVLLNLHGAMVTERYDDPEAEILRKTREIVGEDVPIVVVFDMHGNVSELWLEHSDAIIGFKTAPHTDEYERGLEGGKVISHMLKGVLKPTMAIRKPPILIGGGLMTVVDQPLTMVKSPMYRMVSLARRMEQDECVVNVTVAAGFGHADVPRAGLGIVVTTNNDQTLAEEKASELEKLAWSIKEDFLPNRVLVSLDTGMKEALAAKECPVVLADEGDNAAGGGPADGTYILNELKNAGWPDAALIIRDPEAVREAVKAGISEEVSLAVGGKSDELHGRPVEIRGTISVLSDGTFTDPRQKIVIKMGNTAVVHCGATDLVLTEHTAQQASVAPFLSVGINPSIKRIMVVKSAHAFRREYERFAKLILEVDTPGITSPNLSRFTYRKVRRPIYPLDPM